MCGIAGYATRNGFADPGWLARANQVQRHRGPDGGGEWRSPDGRVGFAHRRLSIIDLSSAADQPMVDGTGRFTIIFNGEIYNFQDLRAELADKGVKFRTQGDTEVILAAYARWGLASVSRLLGQFAFALHDREENRLVLARDRAGEKPLFYHLSGGALRFASELKGLLADESLERRIDPEALDCYLGMGFVPGDRCILEGFRKLPPAHTLVFDLDTGAVQVDRYWSLPEPSGQPSDEARLLTELEELLADAVRRQLVADVPVGVLLSGGVDSSLVTAMAVRASTMVKTFTVRFPGQGKLDETEHARRIAGHFGTDHVELEAAAGSADLLPRLAAQFDEPLIDSSMIPTYLLSQVVRKHCTVALGGDGGDELFGGYNHYSRLLQLRRRTGWVPRGIRAPLGRTFGALPLGTPGRNYLAGLGTDWNREIPLVATYFDPRVRSRLIPGRALGTAEAEAAAAVPAHPDPIERATRSDFATYLPGDILVKVDRASMLNSLEVRAPMLDHRLIEFAFGRVPARLKVGPHGKKILLKRLASRVLPADFDLQRKQGFSIPLDVWFREGPWRARAEEVLAQSPFPPRAVRALFRGQDTGLRNGERIFGLVLLELWRRHYKVTM